MVNGQVALSLEDGRPLETDLTPRSPRTVLPAEPIPALDRSPDGTPIAAAEDGRYGLVALAGDEERLVSPLPGATGSFQVIGSLVVFTLLLDEEGDVYGQELGASRTWHVPLWRRAGRPIDRLVLAALGGVILAVGNREAFGLRPRDGRVLFHTRLPRQSRRPNDAPVRTVFKHDGVIVVRCYEELHALGARSGQHLWSLDTGALSDDVRPTFAGGRVYVGIRGPAMRERLGYAPPPPERRPKPNAVLLRPAEAGAELKLVHQSRYPASRVIGLLDRRYGAASARWRVRQLDSKGRDLWVTDVGQDVQRSREAVFAIAPLTRFVHLLHGSKTVAAVEVPVL